MVLDLSEDCGGQLSATVSSVEYVNYDHDVYHRMQHLPSRAPLLARMLQMRVAAPSGMHQVGSCTMEKIMYILRV